MTAAPAFREATARPAVLLVSHGSRDPRAQSVTAEIVTSLRRRLGDVEVRSAFLDFAEPTPETVLRALAAEGYTSTRVVPLLFSPGYHLTHDVPAAITGSGVTEVTEVSVAPSLVGGSPLARRLLLRALSDRADALRAGQIDRARIGQPFDGLVLASAGSSSKGARTAVEDLARDLGEMRGIPVVAAYASAAQPSTTEALDQLRHAGVENPAVASLFVAPGRLPDAVRRAAGDVPVAEPLGTTPAFVELLASQALGAVWQTRRHDLLPGRG